MLGLGQAMSASCVQNRFGIIFLKQFETEMNSQTDSPMLNDNAFGARSVGTRLAI